MFKRNYRNATIAVLMALNLSSIPQFAAAEVAEKMISTTDLVEEATRAQDEQLIRQQISRKEVQEQLKKVGVSPEEVNARLAGLSNSELRNLSKQMEQVQYAGSLEGILIIVLLVLLIIFLAKRI